MVVILTYLSASLKVTSKFLISDILRVKHCLGWSLSVTQQPQSDTSDGTGFSENRLLMRAPHLHEEHEQVHSVPRLNCLCILPSLCGQERPQITTVDSRYRQMKILAKLNNMCFLIKNFMKTSRVLIWCSS
jgi:hypothetical protein